MDEFRLVKIPISGMVSEGKTGVSLPPVTYDENEIRSVIVRRLRVFFTLRLIVTGKHHISISSEESKGCLPQSGTPVSRIDPALHGSAAFYFQP